MQHVSNKGTAWDCGTGNGQTAQELAKHFHQVWATDISEQQIAHAKQAENIIYSVQPAEHTSFPANTVDLVTISQALHWFRFGEFYDEVKRVGREGGWIVAWMYSLIRITPRIDELVNEQYYVQTLGEYWDKERRYVDENYSGLPFPFEEIETPVFRSEFNWTLEELAGYLNTWSALQKFIDANHFNPVDELIKKLAPFWKTKKMKIIFPVHMRMGKIHQKAIDNRQ